MSDKPRHKDNPLFAEWEKKRKNQDIWDAGKAEAIKMGIVTVDKPLNGEGNE